MGDMDDILNDPRFPDRPDHPDFWKLSEIVLQLDGRSNDEAFSVEGTASEVVDLESLTYMAIQRIAQLHDALEETGHRTHPSSLMTTCWFEGVIVGVMLERRRNSQ